LSISQIADTRDPQTIRQAVARYIYGLGTNIGHVSAAQSADTAMRGIIAPFYCR